MADATLSPAPLSAAPQPAGATGVLVLASGGRRLGPRLRRRGTGGRRGVLPHRDDGLSGDHDRSVLRGADHYLHLPAYRQCRREPRRSGGGQSARAGYDRARGRDRAVVPSVRSSGSTDGWRGMPRIGLSGIDTRALTRRIRAGGAPNGVIAHAADGVVRPAAVAGDGAGLAGAGRHGPRQDGVDRAGLWLGRRRLAAGLRL